MHSNVDVLSLKNHLDCEILLHRNSHFGGQFATMIAYYRSEGKGIQIEFPLARLEKLARIEQKLGMDLAQLLLNPLQNARLKSAQGAYHSVRTRLALGQNPRSAEHSLARLILSDREEPIEQLRAVEQLGGDAVAPLIELFSAREFYDPLYPGFGLAPELAAKCLGLIKDPRAIPALFAQLGNLSFFTEDVVLEALRKIGEPSRDYLLDKLQMLPITEENQKAALALVHFRRDFEVAATGFRLLTDERVRERSGFANFLVMICEGLAGTSLAASFQRLQDDESIPQLLRHDVREVIQTWQL